jgi:hypothetical protein
VGFVVDKVALQQAVLKSSSVFLCQYHSAVALHAHILPGVRKIGPLVATGQGHSHIIGMKNNNMVWSKMPSHKM